MDINEALEAFRVLLTEQQTRIANMNTEKEFAYLVLAHKIYKKA